MDPEAEFFAKKQQTGNEWELYKENVRPSKRGRKVHILNEALKSQSDNLVRKSLLEKRRRLIAAIDEYKGEDPLQPWLECIKWVQESFPTGGECSGLLVIYEQCVRKFWHEDRYKDDLRYLKVWLEYAENCNDAEVIYSFLEANQIGQTHSVYYISYALHLESNHKLKKADEIFNLGIARKAQPLEKLEASFRKFLVRSTRHKNSTKNELVDNDAPVRTFGTVLSRGEARGQTTELLRANRTPLGSINTSRKTEKPQRQDGRAPLSILEDVNSTTRERPETLRSDVISWPTLGTHTNRNKENTAIRTKWTSYKIPQKPGVRTGSAASSSCIEVFVDDECAEAPTAGVADSMKPPMPLRQVDSQHMKKESELLKENPLRNFHDLKL